MERLAAVCTIYAKTCQSTTLIAIIGESCDNEPT